MFSEAGTGIAGCLIRPSDAEYVVLLACGPEEPFRCLLKGWSQTAEEADVGQRIATWGVLV